MSGQPSKLVNPIKEYQHMKTDTFLEIEFDRALAKELKSRTKLTAPPSMHLQAWRDYDHQKFGVLGRHPPARYLGYNLWDEAVNGVEWAYGVLTSDAYRKWESGYSAKAMPVRALVTLAKYVGYRYLRGLEFIEHQLKGDDLQRFRRERQAFRHAFEAQADAAYYANAKGQNPATAIAVVRLYSDELLSLCPWLEQVDAAWGATKLRARATLPR